MRSQFQSRKLRLESLEERTLLAMTAGGMEALSAHAAPTALETWVVNTTDDPAEWDAEDDVLSLRETISRASDGDVINFASSLADGTITLGGSQLEITKAITIDASSIGGITIDADGKSRVFCISGADRTILANVWRGGVPALRRHQRRRRHFEYRPFLSESELARRGGR